MIPERIKRDQQQAKFSYYFARPFTSLLVLLLIFVPITLGLFASYNILGGVVFLLLNSLVAVSAFRLYNNQLRDARFFDDYLELRGRNHLSMTVTYSKVERVEKLVAFPLTSSRTRLRIWIRGEPKPFIIPNNLYNRKLKANLYSWLIGVTAGQQESK